MLAAFKTLLYRYSGQKDICIGTVVANRNRKEIESAVGFFMNTLALRTQIEGDSCFTEVLERVKKTTYDAFTYQELPFDKMVEELKPPREDGVNPFFQVMFILQNTQKVDLELPGVTMQPLDIESGMAPFDLRLQLTETQEGLRGGFDYNLSIFDSSTIRRLAKHLIKTIECIVENQEQNITQLSIFTQEDIKNIHKLKIAVASTFTAEPVEDYISWWCKQFGIKNEVVFAPYNQVFQQLLDETSLISLNDGVNILLIRFEDWLRNNMSEDAEQIKKLEENYTYLLSTLKSKAKSIPYFVGIFPVGQYSNISPKVSEYIQEMNKRWKLALEDMENVYVMDCENLDKQFAIDTVFDTLKDTEAHMPFSDTYFGALGTFTARKICAWKKQNFKVIVLDCDNTLWKGVCGEEGAQGVIISEPFMRLQEIMLDCYREGMLLALCSKNNEADVWEVFDSNNGMLLKKEHFVSWRINWQSKADNIREIAQELNLGVDSFIFIDDSPVECSEVMTKLPEVLTLNLPENAEQIPSYLQHVWAFDRIKVTAEDAQRTQMYIAEKERKQIQDSAHSLDGFIQSLELKMSMNLIENSQYMRAAQLTHRTNQFNLSTIRRTEEELRLLTSLPGCKCHVIEVSDRFGDYGLVGVVITKENGDKLLIDTFLLSCRVLGRRIEDAILVGLKKLCNNTGARILEAEFRPTEKNMPFKKFLEKSGWKSIKEKNGITIYQLDINEIPEQENLVECYFDSKFESMVKSKVVTEVKHEPVSIKQENENTLVSNDWKVLKVNMEMLFHKAYLLPLENASGKLLAALPVHRPYMGKKTVETTNQQYKAPGNKTEKILVQIWQEILGIEKIGVNDDFFKLGGHSLTAVSIISRIRDKFRKYIPLQWIIENRTIAQLGKLIGDFEEADNSDDIQENIPRASDEKKNFLFPFHNSLCGFMTN
nr:HAD-IIIC family phosphatase [Ruminiclostridium josui]